MTALSSFKEGGKKGLIVRKEGIQEASSIQLVAAASHDGAGHAIPPYWKTGSGERWRLACIACHVNYKSCIGGRQRSQKYSHSVI